MARELEPLLNQPSAPADRADTCGAGRRGPERSGGTRTGGEEERKDGTESSEEQFYPTCFKNMALCAYRERQQWGPLSISSWTASLSLHLPLSVFAIVPKPFVFALSGFSVLGLDSAISPATMSPINSNKHYGRKCHLQSCK